MMQSSKPTVHVVAVACLAASIALAADGDAAAKNLLNSGGSRTRLSMHRSRLLGTDIAADLEEVDRVGSNSEAEDEKQSHMTSLLHERLLKQKKKNEDKRKKNGHNDNKKDGNNNNMKKHKDDFKMKKNKDTTKRIEKKDAKKIKKWGEWNEWSDDSTEWDGWNEWSGWGEWDSWGNCICDGDHWWWGGGRKYLTSLPEHDRN